MLLAAATQLHAAAGGLDLSFGIDGKVHTSIGTASLAHHVAMQADGKIVAAGSYYNGNDKDFAIARYTATGELDSSFGSGGTVTTQISTDDDVIQSVALQPDGKIVVAGHCSGGRGNADFAVARYTTSGELDSSFGSGGLVRTDISGGQDYGLTVSVQADGTIFVAGESGNRAAMARYTTLGELDSSFGSGGIVTTNIYVAGYKGMLIRQDGRILVASMKLTGSYYGFLLECYTSSGTLDTNFGTFGSVTASFDSTSACPTSLDVQTDGKIVVAGFTYAYHDQAFAMARFTSSGILDSGFGINGKVTTSFGGWGTRALSVAVQADGKIVVAGDTDDTETGDHKYALARYTNSGALDGSFGAGGKVTTAIGLNTSCTSMALQPDGKILLGGYSQFGVHLARYNVVAPAPVVTVSSITALAASSATLHGAVNPNFAPTNAQFEYGTTTDYGLNAIVTLSPNDDSSTQSVSAKISGLTPGTLYHYRLAATNSGGTSHTSSATFTTPTIYENWRLTHFGSIVLDGSLADDADYDHDGIPNLVEFALNLNPTTSSMLAATTNVANGAAEYIYNRSITAVEAGSIFTVEWSDTLHSGSWSNSGVTQTVLGNDGTLQQVKAWIPINAVKRRFLRLAITPPP